MSTKESLAFRILNYVLIDMDGAPLKKAVMDAGLGNDLSGGYCDSYKQPVWTIEVTGSEVEKQEQFAQVIDGTLRMLALDGIDKDMLDAALNRTEFTSRENDYQDVRKVFSTASVRWISGSMTVIRWRHSAISKISKSFAKGSEKAISKAFS